MNDPDGHMKIEFVSESTDSGDNHQFADAGQPSGLPQKEQTTLSVIGLILALPLPILIIILWATLSVIKQKNSIYGEGTMNAVFLYLLQFFVVPVLSIMSVVIGLIVTNKSKRIARKIGFISLVITAVGIVILGLFLNNH